MRIFHNKITNQVIVVVNDWAYSFYNYTHDNPITTAIESLDSNNNLTYSASACEELQIPGQPLLPEKPNEVTIVHDNDVHTHVLLPEAKPCEHSQNQSKKP